MLAMDSQLQTVLIDICELLQEHGPPFALVGGVAASLRGRLRATEDIDLILLTDVDGALELVDRLNGTAFQPLFPEYERVVRSAYILALEHLPSAITLDLAIGTSGFEQQIIRRAATIPIANLHVQVATAEDLILMKLLASRPQDDQDIAGILAVHGKSIDWVYCESVARELEEVIERELVLAVRNLRDKS